MVGVLASVDLDADLDHAVGALTDAADLFKVASSAWCEQCRMID